MSGIKTMGLYNNVERVLADLASAGFVDTDSLTVADLTPFDQYHYEGASAVDEAAMVLEAGPGMRLLDVGAGLGGPARYLADRSGASVSALELQPDLNALGRSLTARCGLADQVTHIEGDVLTDDVGVDRFDGLMSMLCILHIPDRERLFARCARALTAGAKIFIEDFYQRAPMTDAQQADLAHEVSCPYLPDLDTYRHDLQRAGFIEIEVTDKTDDWTFFVVDRLAIFRAAEAELTQRYNPTTFASLERFYATVAALYQSGNLGGVRLSATLSS